MFGAEVGSFRLHLAAEGKAERTIRGYTEAVAWLAAARLLGEAGKTGGEQADRRDVQEWMTWLLCKYSDAYGIGRSVQAGDHRGRLHAECPFEGARQNNPVVRGLATLPPHVKPN